MSFKDLTEKMVAHLVHTTLGTPLGVHQENENIYTVLYITDGGELQTATVFTKENTATLATENSLWEINKWLLNRKMFQ